MTMVTAIITTFLALVLLTGLLLAVYQSRSRMSRGRRKLVLTLHVITSVGWLGAAIAMTILLVAGFITRNPVLRHAAFTFMHVYDLTIMIPLGYLALVTGVLLSVGTNWGLLKHWWIVTKLVLTIAVLAFAGFFTSGWVLGAVARTAEDPMADLGALAVQLAVNFAAFNVVFWTTTIISIYKPWGPTPRGKRKLAEQAAAKQASDASQRMSRSAHKVSRLRISSSTSKGTSTTKEGHNDVEGV
jgi:hypothetical protein